MTDTRALVGTLVSVLLCLSCGEMGNVSGQNCLSVQMPDGNLVTSPPSKVSLFFTVDTCGGEPVAGLTASSFQLQEDDRPVSAYESNQSIQPKGRRFRMYSLLLLDLSGSILKSGNYEKLASAAKLYVDQVLGSGGDGQRVAVYAFDGRPTIFPVVEFSADASVIKAAIDRLKDRQCTISADCSAFEDRRTCSGWMCVDESTNLNGAVVGGIDRIERELQTDASIPFRDSALVVFTDGTDQAARVSADAAEAKLRSSRPHIFTIGLGGEVDEDALRAFGRDGFQRAEDAGELENAFKEIASRIVGMASRFYLLEYCSPKRGGSHTLTINVTQETPKGLLQGSLTRKFDASGFGSGCELAPVTQPMSP
ncbi:MAG: hypothetical protein ACT4TC_13765 [Myxococcaceae bacterium]